MQDARRQGDSHALTSRPHGRLRPGDSVLFIDRKDRRYLRLLRAGVRIAVRGGTVDCDALIGEPDGRRVTNSANETFLVSRDQWDWPTAVKMINTLRLGAVQVEQATTAFSGIVSRSRFLSASAGLVADFGG